MAASRDLIVSTLQVGLLLLALNLAQPETVSAQDLDSVTITGRVLDQNAAVIPGAIIEASFVKTPEEAITRYITQVFRFEFLSGILTGKYLQANAALAVTGR